MKLNIRWLFALLGALLLIGASVLAQDAPPEGDPALDTRFAGRPELAAPEFVPGLEWINVEAPLTIAALRGKVVILDFWTYGCINCIHMIPTLERLEQTYGDALVVIGVHSAKFDNEGETENLRQIVQRYELHHPVINDDQFIVWRTYGVRAWPTFIIIDPRGNILAQQAGEVPYEVFDQFIGGMVAYWDGLGEIDRTPIALALEGADTPPGLLAFPGKVLADAAGGRLFIADTNHHRIIVADLNTYQVLDVIGAGAAGFTDGAYDAAQFDKPHGMALRGDRLYVADSENHAVRVVDLAAREVTTLAGTGQQAYGRFPVGVAGMTTSIALSSPWDVAFGDDTTLFVAMAGTHQIWSINLDTDVVSVAVGNGREALVEGALADAELAQPSGLYYADGVLYWADSESSTIRAADFTTGTTRTVAGTTQNNLFDFGDVDGAVGVSRLQHPLGLAGAPDGTLFVADTYNSRIKRLDPTTNTITSLYGQGSPGAYVDGAGEDAAFDEPGGLAYADGRLFVADTNNHAIRVIDLASGMVQTLVFPNPEALQIAGRTTVIGGNRAQDELLTFPLQTVAAGDGAVVLRFTLPDGFKLNPDAPSHFELNSAETAALIPLEALTGAITALEMTIPAAFSAGTDTLFGLLELYYCDEGNESLCYIDMVRIEAPIEVIEAEAAAAVIVERQIVPPALIGGL